MGACGSTTGPMPPPSVLKAEKISDKEINDTMRRSDADDGKVNKLLLLGAGASGKSTLFKQMISIYGKGFSDSERKTYVNIIFTNIINAMKMLVKQSPRFGQFPPDLLESKKVMESDMKEDQPLTTDLAYHIRTLWNSPLIQLTFEHQNEFQLTDSAKYLFDRIDVISAFGYLPSEQDVLRSRAPTTGIVESTFTIDGNRFAMFDVGGQRNERKKWIHCFENVTAVLFVAALSEYNQVLYEDETQNRLIESLILFDEICNSKWLKKTSMILFLNKSDIFAEKIKKFPLSDFFNEYNEANTYEAASQWIQQQFESKNQERDRQIFCHITTATDKQNVQAVFSAVKDIIVRKNLNRVGLL